MESTGYIGTLIYGFVLRMLGPFGLHHIFYLPFWTTALGGAEVIEGQLVEGTQRIFFAQLGDPDTTQYYIGISRFMSGRFITMMFGLLGACLAIYHTAKPEKKKVVGGLMLSAGLTSFLTGITEPIEFSFLFVAPALYVLHAFLTAAPLCLPISCKSRSDRLFRAAVSILCCLEFCRGRIRQIGFIFPWWAFPGSFYTTSRSSI